MKHSATREFFAYWNEKRARAAAPERSDLAPEGMRHLLGDVFVLGYDRAAGFPFRVAGTRVCALLGRDAKGESFANLFESTSRGEFDDLIGVVAEETLATVAGVSALTASGVRAHLELLLLPFSARSHSPVSLTGSLVLLGDNASHPRAPLTDFALTSWRHTGEAQTRSGPRNVHKWSVVRGLTVYEGLR